MAQMTSSWELLSKQETKFTILKKKFSFSKEKFRATVAKKITFWFIMKSVLPTLTQNLNFQILREFKFSYFYNLQA